MKKRTSIRSYRKPDNLYSPIEEDGIKYDQIFCVFDRDNQPSAFAEAVELCKSRKFIPIVSNPCFEIWPFLHFQLRESGFGDPQQGLKSLKKLPGFEDYDKDGVQIFKSTIHLVEVACKHALLLASKQFDDPKKDPFLPTHREISHSQRKAKLFWKKREVRLKMKKAIFRKLRIRNRGITI